MQVFLSKSIYLAVLCLSIIVVTICCKRSTAESNQKELSTEFLSFYDKFHSDSAFQMEHINFPLSGKPEMMVRDTNTFEWQRSEWIFHKPFDTRNREFSRDLHMIDENLVEEIIQHKTTGFGMKRRFAQVSGQWMLIYYVGMNPPENMN